MYRKALLGAILFLAGSLSALVIMIPAAPSFEALARGDGGGAACRPGDLNGDGAVNITDPVYLLAHLFRAGPAPVACPAPSDCAYFIKNLETSTFVIVRHAERDPVGADPGLNEDGQERARRLAAILAGAPVTHLIASDLRRTQETLAPLAEATDLEVEPIAGEDDVVGRLRELPLGSFAVVAHHSFTIHDILEGLGLSDVRDIPVSGEHHENMFVVVSSPDPDLGVQMVHLKY